jgi:hypothetical protein
MPLHRVERPGPRVLRPTDDQQVERSIRGDAEGREARLAVRDLVRARIEPRGLGRERGLEGREERCGDACRMRNPVDRYPLVQEHRAARLAPRRAERADPPSRPRRADEQGALPVALQVDRDLRSERADETRRTHETTHGRAPRVDVHGSDEFGCRARTGVGGARDGGVREQRHVLLLRQVVELEVPASGGERAHRTERLHDVAHRRSADEQHARAAAAHSRRSRST